MPDISQSASGPPPAQTTPPNQPVNPPPAPSPPSQPPPSPPTESVATAQDDYASFGRRFLAVLIDVVILAVIVTMISAPLGIIIALLNTDSVTSLSETSTSPLLLFLPFIIQIVNLFINIGYPLYFIGSRGQTPGKMIMKIKVLRIDQQEPPGYTTAFLRETVGKFISGLVFALGYFWMIWDDKKQAWHDKIANTTVVRVE